MPNWGILDDGRKHWITIVSVSEYCAMIRKIRKAWPKTNQFNGLDTPSFQVRENLVPALWTQYPKTYGLAENIMPPIPNGGGINNWMLQTTNMTKLFLTIFDSDAFGTDLLCYNTPYIAILYLQQCAYATRQSQDAPIIHINSGAIFQSVHLTRSSVLKWGMYQQQTHCSIFAALSLGPFR